MNAPLHGHADLTVTFDPSLYPKNCRTLSDVEVRLIEAACQKRARKAAKLGPDTPPRPAPPPKPGQLAIGQRTARETHVKFASAGSTVTVPHARSRRRGRITQTKVATPRIGPRRTPKEKGTPRYHANPNERRRTREARAMRRRQHRKQAR